MKTKQIIVGVGLVAAAGVFGAYLTGLVPPKGGVEGTIGAAKRYQAGQMTDQDVVLQDAEIQTLLQSDVFHEVIANPEFRKLIREEHFKIVMTDPAFAKVVNSEEMKKLLDAKSAEYEKKVRVIEAGKTTGTEELSRSTKVAEDAGKGVQTAEELERSKKQTEYYKSGTATEDAAKRSKNVEMMKGQHASELERSAKEAEMLKVINTEDLEKIAKANPEVAGTIRSEHLKQVLNNEAFLRLWKESEAFRTIVAGSSSALQKLAEKDELSRLADSAEEGKLSTQKSELEKATKPREVR